MNCCVAPMAMLGVAGEMVTELRVFAAAGTLTVAFAETPLTVAVTVAEPAATAEARPDGAIFAIAAFDDVHVAEAVTSAVELSL